MCDKPCDDCRCKPQHEARKPHESTDDRPAMTHDPDACCYCQAANLTRDDWAATIPRTLVGR